MKPGQPAPLTQKLGMEVFKQFVRKQGAPSTAVGQQRITDEMLRQPQDHILNWHFVLKPFLSEQKDEMLDKDELKDKDNE